MTGRHRARFRAPRPSFPRRSQRTIVVKYRFFHGYFGPILLILIGLAMTFAAYR